jgi:hypothetical protein
MTNRATIAALTLLSVLVACASEPAPTPATVDGVPLLTVTEVLAKRAEGGLRGERVAVYGFWSDGSIGHSCTPPREPTGELELYCHDGEWGITERSEPIFVIDNSGNVIARATGPHLTPFVPDDVARADELFRIAHVRMPGFAPVPIVVIGHFDDPKAADCGPRSRQLCLDRLVVEKIVQLGGDSEP